MGLAYVAQFAVIGLPAVTYALLSITAGVCGYYAICKGGYIALLTAITMCIVAGHGDDSIDIGLWRTANVVIGIGIALVFSFAFPLHASYSWRYGTASNLRRCARLIGQLLEGCAPRADLQIAVFADLSARLVSLRAMMPSVSKESNVSLKELEDIQRCHRALLSGVEMLATASSALTEAHLQPEVRRAFLAHGRTIRRSLVSMARALRSRSAWSSDVVTFDALSFHTETAMMPVELHGPYWLLAQIATQCAALDQSLGKVNIALMR